jgi:2-desacetyl-2-hydroxyethyl bacteriochlorophyllide A dehydrogenase
MPRALVLNSPRQLSIEDYDDVPLQAGEVRAKAVLSGISHGTELNLYSGNNPFIDREFDRELRLFVPRAERNETTLTLGYEWVGRVTDIGSGVTAFKIGDLVHLPYPHRETHTFTEGQTSSLGDFFPLEISPEDAIVLALAGVALQAIHDAHVKVGDHVTIFGMGAIGLLAVQLAKLNGAGHVDAVDPLESRRHRAAGFGADSVFNPSDGDVAYAIKSGSPTRGADVAIDFSGSYDALNEAIRVARMGGTVVAGGFYRGGGTPLTLGAEWHHNRVTLLSSMGVWNCPHRDFPLWNRGRIHETCANLLAAGKLRTDGLITHRIPFEEAPRAYELIEKNPGEALKVVLTY